MAIVFLQKVIRGRAVQNMVSGRNCFVIVIIIHEASRKITFKSFGKTVKTFFLGLFEFTYEFT